MTPDDPRHGTRAGALAHWRSGETPCPPCARAALRASKAAKMRLDKGIRNRIPLGAAAWNILDTVGCTTVASRTGLTRNNLYRMQRGGPDTIVLRSARDKILTVERAFTPIGVHRRLRALAAIGYTMPQIAALVGCHPEPLTRIVRRGNPPQLVKKRIGEGICRAYIELHMKPLPASRIATRQRNRAAANRWATPLAWDRIDDPNEKPSGGVERWHSANDLDPVVVQRFFEGDWNIRSTKAERFAITNRWTGRGGTLGELERITGWKVDRYVTRQDGAA